jgi:hypothetical protein
MPRIRCITLLLGERINPNLQNRLTSHRTILTSFRLEAVLLSSEPLQLAGLAVLEYPQELRVRREKLFLCHLKDE